MSANCTSHTHRGTNRHLSSPLHHHRLPQTTFLPTLSQRTQRAVRLPKQFLIHLQAFISECDGIERAAPQLGTWKSTLKKILTGKMIDRRAAHRIHSILNGTILRKPLIAPARLNRLKQAHTLYLEHATLAATGKVMGITRERVRQLLTRGQALGLFLYTPNKRKKSLTRP